jgi:phenylpropionate dioxygenase-like ring-hydroxylating dioxygenase large terminal subunit
MLDLDKTTQGMPFLSEPEIAAVQRPLNQAATLPPQAFTSPEIYALEEQKIFRKHWLCVGHVGQIPNPGDYFSFDLSGEPLVVTRDFNGHIQALSNVCRHRSMTLVEGSGNAKSLLCPYHYWSYALDGQLIAAPGMKQAENFHKTEICLPKLRVEIWEGFIFINFDRDAQPLGPQLATLSQLVANYQLPEMRIVETLDYDCQFNWKQAIENTIEHYHHTAVHSKTLNRVAPTDNTVDLQGDKLYNISRVVGKAGTPQHGLPMMDNLQAWQCSDLLLLLIYPCNLFAFFPERLTFMQLSPDSVGRFTMKFNYCMPAANLDKPDYVDALKKVVSEFAMQVNREDMAINEGVWKGLQSCLGQAGRFSHLEKTIWEFDQWWLQQMLDTPSQNSGAIE